MQSVLGTPELVAIIMENLWKLQPSNELADSSQLRGCVRVNRLFSQEALRLIWREIDGLEKLVYLLPQGAYTTSGVDYLGKKKLQRNLDFDFSKPNTWQRIIETTPRIRRCNFHGGQGYQIGSAQLSTWNDLTFMQFYQRSYPERPLFPHLIYLNAYLGSHPGGLSGLINSCSTLRKIKIDLYHSQHHFAIEERRLKISLRTLTSLESLSMIEESSLSKEILETLLQRNQRLKTLLIGYPVQLRHIPLISSLHSLRQLHLEGGVEFSMAQLSMRSNTRGSGCPLLEELHVMAGIENVEITLKALHALQARPSKELVIVTWQPIPSGHQFIPLFLTVGSFADKRLETFSLRTEIDIEDEGEETDWVLPSSAIESLYEFNSLKKLYLDIGIPIDLVDDDISRMLSTFPEMEELHLSCTPEFLPAHFATRLSSSCLVQLAIGGPKLRKIGLLVNEEWIKLVDTCCSKSLITEVKVGKSTPPFTLTAEEAACQLVDIFPNIITLLDIGTNHNYCEPERWSRDEDHVTCKWQEISELIPGLKRSREWATKRTLWLLKNAGELQGSMCLEELERLVSPRLSDVRFSSCGR